MKNRILLCIGMVIFGILYGILGEISITFFLLGMMLLIPCLLMGD